MAMHVFCDFGLLCVTGISRERARAATLPGGWPGWRRCHCMWHVLLARKFISQAIAQGVFGEAITAMLEAKAKGVPVEI